METKLCLTNIVNVPNFIKKDTPKDTSASNIDIPVSHKAIITFGSEVMIGIQTFTKPRIHAVW